MASIDPLSVVIAVAGLGGFYYYTQQQPTQDTVTDEESTVTQHLQQRGPIILSCNRNDFSNLNQEGDESLKLDRPADDMPTSYKDSPEFLRWARKHRGIGRKKSVMGARIDSQVTSGENSLQELYEKKYKPTHAHAVDATIDSKLLSDWATNQRKLGDTMSGRTNGYYHLSTELAPILVFKHPAKAARFAPYQNIIDDNPYSASQAGISRSYPAETRGGWVSNKYPLKRNANDGPWVEPGRMAPSRYDRGWVTRTKPIPKNIPRVPTSAFSS